MTVEEIFAALAAHMAKGIQIHNAIAAAFGFLNLHGFQRCHEYHFLEESKSFRALQNFYLDTYHKVIPIGAIEAVDIIPTNWYKHIIADVDINTKRNGIKELMKKWVNWEQETQNLWKVSYTNLYSLGEVFAAIKIGYFLEDNALELSNAYKEQNNLETIDYDMSVIIENQDALYHHYSQKIKGEN